MGRTGLYVEYVVPAQSSLSYTGGATTNVGLIGGVLFLQTYLRTRESQPRLHPVFSAMVGLNALAFPIGLLGFDDLSVLLSALLTAAFFSTGLCAEVVRARDGFTPARYFLVAWLALLIAGLLYIGRLFTWLPFNFWTTHGLMVGSAIEAVLLSLGLADRVRAIKREQEHAETLARGAQREALEARLATEEERRQSQQSVLSHVLSARERERSRIAAELHDSLGQNLLATKSLISAAGDDLQPQTRANLSRCVQACIDEARTISRNLHPSQLERLGLADAINAAAESLSVGDVVVETHVSPEAAATIAASDDGAIHVYRIVQEALSNALRHGEASYVEATIRSVEDTVDIESADNGSGFEMESLGASGDGIGLATMRERARALGGEMTLRSAPGEGTVVELTLQASAK